MAKDPPIRAQALHTAGVLRRLRSSEGVKNFGVGGSHLSNFGAPPSRRLARRPRRRVLRESAAAGTPPGQPAGRRRSENVLRAKAR